jgi:hypothetical protein
MVRLYLPYVVVAFAAIAFASLEILKTFGREIFTALRHRWAWALIGINVVTALIVYIIVRLALKTGDDMSTALLVGLSFPIVLRSRFTYFRAVGAQEDKQLDTLSLKLDEAYNKLQDLCWESVDIALADKRARQAEQLAARTPTDELIQRLEYLIAARHIEHLKVRDQKLLEEIKQIPDEKMRKFRLAMMLIDVNPAHAQRSVHR